MWPEWALTSPCAASACLDDDDKVELDGYCVCDAGHQIDTSNLLAQLCIPCPKGRYTHSALRSHTHTHAQQTQETIFGPQGRASRAQPWFDPVRASSRFIGQLRPRHRRRQGLSRQPHLPAAVVASLGLRRLRPRGRHGGGCAAAPLPEGRLEARGHGGASCAVDVCRSSAALC